MKREERMAKKQREDQALNRVLLWFGGAVILEFLLLVLNRYYIHYDMSGIALAHGLAAVLVALVWLGLAGAVASAAWLLVWKGKGKRLFWPSACLIISLVLALCAAVSRAWKEVGVQFLYVAVPAVAVLALIYYLYQREFFVVAAQGGCALLAMWAYRKLLTFRAGAVYAAFGVLAAATVALLVVLALAQRGDGKLGKWQIFGKKAGYPMMYVGGVITLCALAAALALGATAAYVALFVVVAWVFGAAIYYTVRLM